MKHRILIIAVLFSLLSTSAYAQSLLKGIVYDSSGLSIPGVNIHEKESGSGVVTNMDGEYSIYVNKGDVLEFSFIGFQAQTVEVGDQTELNITLFDDVEQLSEVVVVGYGTQKRSSLTGAVGEVDNEQLTQIPASSLDQALQGRLAGVNVTSNSGAPGEGVSVRIRGVGSINSNNDPLYIVDGVPTKDAFNVISPQDIESVSVLKDAGSSSIYGSRANNGVILITTKKGKSGSLRVSFNQETGVQRPSNTLKMANRDQYAEVYNEAATNDNYGVDDPLFQRKLMSPEYIAAQPDVNHQDEIYRNGILQNYNLNISGGNEKTTYSFGGNYFGQEGIIVGSNYEKFSGRFNIETSLSDKLKVGVNFNLSNATTDIVSSSGDGYAGGGGSVVRYALMRTPGINTYDQNGDFVDMPDDPQFWGDGYNPVGVAKNAQNQKIEDRYFGDVHLGWSVTDDLYFKSTVGFDNFSYNQRNFNKTWGTNDRINNPNSLSVWDARHTTNSWSNVLSYTKSAGSHSFNLMGGQEAINYSGYENQGSQNDFADQDPSLVYLGNGNGQIQVFESAYGYSLLSFFGRVNYDYKDKYFASATIRQDGSSRFAEGNRWGTFYSFSGGWRLDQEDFLKGSDVINVLKLRGGYGKVGNQDVGYYAYSDRYSINYNYAFGNVPRDGYVQTVLGNQNIKWETSNQFDLGLDYSMYNRKLYGSVDFFNKVTEDMLVKASIPPSNGNTDPAWVNSGSVLNRGIELALGTEQKIGEFSFAVDANLSFLHNEVLSLDAPIYGGRIDNGIYATKTEVGHSVGSFFLYEMDGIFQNDYDIVTSAYQGQNIQPGDVKFVDQNGDGVIDENDRVHVGSAIPKFTYGINLSGAYKNWDFSAFFQGAGGHQIYNQIATDIEGFHRAFNITERYYNDRWTGEGTSNTQPRASWNAKANNTMPSTRFLEDADYLRLKNIQIGYTLNPQLLESLRIQHVRVYVSANNLFTWSKYSGLDPEMTVSQNSAHEGDIASGIDWGTYPTAKSFMIGVQLRF